MQTRALFWAILFPAVMLAGFAALALWLWGTRGEPTPGTRAADRSSGFELRPQGEPGVASGSTADDSSPPTEESEARARFRFVDEAAPAGVRFTYFNGADPASEGMRMFEFTGGGVGVLDYDADGRLDLFLVEDRFAGGSSALYRNTGDLGFVDVTGDVGLPARVDGLGVAATDLSGDGRPDLFVAGSNRMFVNVDGERFREVDTDEFDWPTFGDEDDVAGVAASDLNVDGRVDLVVGQHYNSTLDGDRRVAVRLYLNQGAEQGDPRFRDVTDVAGLVALPTKAPHVEVVDFDADGRLDVLTTASAGDGERPAVFRGLGVEDGVPRFEAPDGLGSDQYWVTGATDDFDHDGRLDILLVDFEPGRPSRLLAGEHDAGHWLAVGVGHAGTDGIGDRVDVYPAGALGDDARRIGTGAITATTGFSGGAVPVARFGLGGATAVDVRIQTPAGESIELPGVSADQLVLVDTDAGCTG
jgi:enediyne biosynthesis protein E4